MDIGLTHSQTMTLFWRPWDTSLLKTLWEKEKLLVTVFSTRLENFLVFSANSKLSSAYCFSLDQSKICRLVMG